MFTRAPCLSDRCCRHNLVAISGGFLWPRINVNSVHQSGRQYLIRSSVSLSSFLIYLVIVVKLRLNYIKVSCFILPFPHFVLKKSECKKVCLDIGPFFIICTLSNINFSKGFYWRGPFTKSIAIVHPKLSYFKLLISAFHGPLAE